MQQGISTEDYECGEYISSQKRHQISSRKCHPKCIESGSVTTIKAKGYRNIKDDSFPNSMFRLSLIASAAQYPWYQEIVTNKTY